MGIKRSYQGVRRAYQGWRTADTGVNRSAEVITGVKGLRADNGCMKIISGGKEGLSSVEEI